MKVGTSSRSRLTSRLTLVSFSLLLSMLELSDTKVHDT
jgi:hypothetical protein